MNSSAPSSGVLASPCSAVTQNTDMTLANRGHVDGEGAKRTEGRQQRLPVPVAPEEAACTDLDSKPSHRKGRNGKRKTHDEHAVHEAVQGGSARGRKTKSAGKVRRTRSVPTSPEPLPEGLRPSTASAAAEAEEEEAT
mmetsp:Transcript_99153/g.276104  ORF Transcript_99153/g.276104 Transcript_99153/m.276104 type:complete len:138 (+) Transcript_99153:2-415(+)